MRRGYTFREFVAAIEGEDFNVVEPKAYEWAEWVENVNLNREHDGDCVNFPMPCVLCAVLTHLEEYQRYTFHPAEFELELKEWGILK